MGAPCPCYVTAGEKGHMKNDGTAVQDQTLEDLTLLLIYLTSWEEKV
jgi:hypothetical protein